MAGRTSHLANPDRIGPSRLARARPRSLAWQIVIESDVILGESVRVSMDIVVDDGDQFAANSLMRWLSRDREVRGEAAVTMVAHGAADEHYCHQQAVGYLGAGYSRGNATQDSGAHHNCR